MAPATTRAKISHVVSGASDRARPKYDDRTGGCGAVFRLVSSFRPYLREIAMPKMRVRLTAVAHIFERPSQTAGIRRREKSARQQDRKRFGNVNMREAD